MRLFFFAILLITITFPAVSRAQAISGKSGSRVSQRRYVHKDGRTVWAQVIGAVLRREFAGFGALAGALVSVTPETSTSIRLLRLLLDVRRGLAGVRYIRGLEPAQADAMLMIGDQAMRMRQKRPEGFTHTLDLGADWLEWTGLSFVYAVWTVRRTLADEVRRDLGEFLESSLAAGLADLPAVARKETGPGWAAEETEAYLRRFHYRLGPEDLAGMERFEALLREHALIDRD